MRCATHVSVGADDIGASVRLQFLMYVVLQEVR